MLGAGYNVRRLVRRLQLAVKDRELTVTSSPKPLPEKVFASCHLWQDGVTYARAFCLIASNSACVIAPESSSPLAFSISAVAPPLVAVVRT